MKKYILSAAIIALTTVAFAQNKEEPATMPMPAQTEKPAMQDSSKTTPVELGALPEAVKLTLASPAYKAWTPTEAFLVKGNGTEFYQINVTKEEEKGSVKIKADGTPVPE